MRRRREACECGPPAGGGLAFALALMLIVKAFWVCRVRNRFLRRSVLDFLFLGLGVWGEELFSLAALFFWCCFSFVFFSSFFFLPWTFVLCLWIWCLEIARFLLRLISMIFLHIVHHGLLTLCWLWRVWRARQALLIVGRSVSRLGDRGAERGGGGGLGRNVYCEDEERWEVRWEVRCRLLVLRKISQQKSPGGDLGRDLMRNIMIIAYMYKNEFLDI